MGCGHSKINIYPRKCRSKISLTKKSVAPEVTEKEEEEGIESETDTAEKLEEQRRAIKIKGVGGPLLTHTEISTSQQDFFKMLDEKIEKGRDYDSGCEEEMLAEATRLNALLQDWETASAGSRSLPATPMRIPVIEQKVRPSTAQDGARGSEARMLDMPRSADRAYNSAVTMQSYGVTPGPYRNYPPVYPSASSSNPLNAYQESALQYQALSPMYTSQPTYPPPIRNFPPYGSPIKVYMNNLQKHVTHENQPRPHPFGSPTQKPYTNSPKHTNFNNGDIHQQMYAQQLQYQQMKEYHKIKSYQQQQIPRDYQQQQQQQGRDYQPQQQQQGRDYQQQQHVRDYQQQTRDYQYKQSKDIQNTKEYQQGHSSQTNPQVVDRYQQVISARIQKEQQQQIKQSRDYQQYKQSKEQFKQNHGNRNIQPSVHNSHAQETKQEALQKKHYELT